MTLAQSGTKVVPQWFNNLTIRNLVTPNKTYQTRLPRTIVNSTRVYKVWCWKAIPDNLPSWQWFGIAVPANWYVKDVTWADVIYLPDGFCQSLGADLP